MTNPKYDLAVAYRIYPGVSKSPLIFAENKYRLAELCLRSFKASLGTLKVKMWVLLDGCPEKYVYLFRDYFDTDDLEFIKLNGVGNFSTFRMQLEILSEQTVAEMVYFAEDDYFYLPNEFEQMTKFMLKNVDVDFVSPYDHPDYYRIDLGNHSNFIKVFNNRHWRTANSTCLTFLTTRSTLLRTKNIFKSYAYRNFDASLWLSLTKHKLFNPFTFAKYLVQEPLLFKVILKAWFFCWNQILFGKRWKLWVPIPSIATHMEVNCLAPGIDWLDLIRSQIQQMAHSSISTE